MQVYFTFKTFSDAGIGDQLGAQFAHLFALGAFVGGHTYIYRVLDLIDGILAVGIPRPMICLAFIM